MTKSIYKVQGELNKMWFDYYTKPITSEKRVNLTEDFIINNEEYINVSAFHHPQLSMNPRTDLPKQELVAILADFILRAEEDDSRSTKSRELELRHDDRDRKNNFHIYEGREINAQAGETMPTGYISEEDYVMDMYVPRSAVTEEQVYAELANVKAYPEYYATTLSENHGKDYADTLDRIKRLDLDRVRTCLQCEDGFYTRDMRRMVCDRQQGLLADGTPTDLSMCELNFKKNEEMWRNRIKRQR